VEYFEDPKEDPLMGRYLSISCQFDHVQAPARLVEPAFSNPFFGPVAIGGLDAHEAGDNWFLAGYALEDFISRFLERGTSKPVSIALARTAEKSQAEYLSTTSNWLSHQKLPGRELSPFESRDPSVGVTFIRQVTMDAEVLDELDRWIARFPSGVFYLYGTAQLAVQNPCEIPWNHAFRFLYPRNAGLQGIGAPFLFIRVGASPFSQSATEVTLFSESTVWLQEDRAFNGRVRRQDAAKNLAGLASLARCVAHNPEATAPVSVNLRADGGPFQRELDWLQLAFADILAKSG
jgi:hypothetical protein